MNKRQDTTAQEDLRFLAGEREVELHSRELRKELSLPNLVFTQVLSILGLSWIGSAGKLGSGHLMFWMGGILLFYVPSALVVIHLNTEMPLEGGLYQWAKLRFSEMTGFMVAFNIWLYNIVFASTMGVLMANNVAYAIGPGGAWISNSKPVIAGCGLLITAILVSVARVGLALGKWIHGFSGFMILFLFGSMICLALPHWVGGHAVLAPVSLAVPAFTLVNINILSRMGFGALGGFDTVSTFAGECRGEDVAATIRRSVWIATPIIAGSFVLGTACVLVFVKPDDIDLISPITQVLSRGLQAAGLPGSATSIVGTLIVVTLVGQAVLAFNSSARLPMVAGWDHLLPAWFTRLHPRYKTPGNSITLLAAGALGIALVTSLGSGNQEAYQMLQSASGIAYGLAYLAMFAIPMVAPGEKPSLFLRAAALSGFLMTLLNVVLSLFPIIDVPDPVAYGLKIGGLVLALNTAGAWFYRRATAARARA
jgi:amino acid transporter